LLHVKMDFEAVGLLKSSFITKDEIKHFSWSEPKTNKKNDFVLSSQ
jgi:hypothetical protein